MSEVSLIFLAEKERVYICVCLTVFVVYPNKRVSFFAKYSGDLVIVLHIIMAWHTVRDGLQIRKVSVNKLRKQSRVADKGLRRSKNPHSVRTLHVTKR